MRTHLPGGVSLLSIAFMGTMVQLPRARAADDPVELTYRLKPGMDGMDLQNIVQQSQPALPCKPVKPGDSWTQAYEFKVPGVAGRAGAVASNLECTYRRMEPVGDRECARIGVAGTVSVEDLKSAGAQPGMPMAQVNIDQMHVFMDGNLCFDPLAGRLVEQQL